MDDRILFSEMCPANDNKIYIVGKSGKENVSSVSGNKLERKTIKQKLWFLMLEMFLPQGYPHSVTEDYSNYQMWDTAQAFCSTILGILATQEILRGVGVGDASASATAATVTWVLRDATAHVGRITFAWSKGSSMDSSSKEWRLFADILNDIALGLELMLPLIGYTVWVLCITTAMKAIVGVAGSATRVALTQHQALRNNLADVAAKDSSQETAINLLASLVAVVFLPKNKSILMLWWLVLASSHIYCNYRAVKSICLTTINSTRFLQLIKLYLMHEIVAPPHEINSREPLFFKEMHTDKSLSGFNIKIAQPLSSIVKQREISQLEMSQLTKLHASLNYLLVIDPSRFVIYVLLNESATSEDILCSYFHAIILGIAYHSINRLPLRILNPRAEYADKPFAQLCRAVREKHPPKTTLHPQLLTFLRDVCINEWKQFHSILKDTGWHTDRELLEVGEWRANWHDPAASPPVSPHDSFSTRLSTSKCGRQKRNSEWMIEANNFVRIHGSDHEVLGRPEKEEELITPGDPLSENSLFVENLDVNKEE